VAEGATGTVATGVAETAATGGVTVVTGVADTIGAPVASGGGVGVWAGALNARARMEEQMRKVVFMIIGLPVRCSSTDFWIQLLVRPRISYRWAIVRAV
jgi:hypothetical protein